MLAFTSSDTLAGDHSTYDMNFESEVTVRGVLSALTREYGIQWHAMIRPQAGHSVLRIQGDGRNIDVFRRVDLTLNRGPLPKLVR